MATLTLRLNPFRSGQCLSTENIMENLAILVVVSIPFDQGNVFRLVYGKTKFFSCVSIPFDQGNVFRLIK